MDIVRLYKDFGVTYYTEGHKHTRPGWVNTECPFCTGNVGVHLGWNVVEEYYVCWRCGWHPPLKTLSAILELPQQKVREIVVHYGVNRSVLNYKAKDKKEFRLPTGVQELGESHKEYLLSRKFNPDTIQKLWGVKATGPISKIDKISYKFRIVIPFFWNGEMVSFDSRDITGKQKEKYQACPKEYEKVEHKHILYGNQEAWQSTGIGVEGPTDVWRMGELSCATSGIKYRPEQVKVIAHTFKRFAVVFDDDPQAIVQANKLVAELRFRGVDSWREPIKGDPGGLSDKDAKELVNRIMKRK